MIIVTSKNVITALDKSGIAWKHLSLVCVGTISSLFALNHGGDVVYVAQGYAQELAHHLLSHYSRSHFFYPHAKKVAFDITPVLKTQKIEVEECVVYETRCGRDKIDIANDGVIVFGAPSSVECFLSLYGWKESWSAVAIGVTTAKSFPPYITPLISPHPSYEEAIKYVLKEIQR
jgi:uroporphyrinogen-III synthase